jgi:hypothetical protein
MTQPIYRQTLNEGLGAVVVKWHGSILHVLHETKAGSKFRGAAHNPEDAIETAQRIAARINAGEKA